MPRYIGLSPQKVDFDSVWARLADGIEKIVTLSGVESGMRIYEDVYKLCTAAPTPHSERLYRHLKCFLENHTLMLLQDIQKSQSDVLNEYIKHWGNYSVGCRHTGSLFNYLNMYWVKAVQEESKAQSAPLQGIEDSKSLHLFHGIPRSPGIFDVFTLCLMTWKECLYDGLKTRLISTVLNIVECSRNGEAVNISLVTSFFTSLMKLGAVHKAKQLELYQNEYEVYFLDQTSKYYARESASFLAENGVSAYMEKAEARLEEEILRASKLLDSSSHEKLRSRLHEVLVAKHKDLLVAECESYLSQGRIKDLNRLYSLLNYLPGGIDPILEIVQCWIVKSGFEVLKAIPDSDRRNPQVVVEKLLLIYHNGNRLVQQAFFDDNRFIVVLQKACRIIVNEPADSTPNSVSRTPELLARFCDILLRKGKNNLEESLLEEKLTHIITIFKFLDEKDVFQTFYSKLLAKRLINVSSVSEDAESAVITGLKQVCGFEYVNKLHRMFTDISLSSEMVDIFKDIAPNSFSSLRNSKVDFSVLVLTSGCWPLSTQQPTFIFPSEVECWMTAFQDFYGQKHRGRKLNWLPQLSKGEVKCLVMKRSFEFQVTCYQAGVLLLFEQCESLNTENILKMTGITPDDLARTVKSLVDAKLLLKTDHDSSSSTYALNISFMSKRLRVKVVGSLRAERPEEAPVTYTDIEKDRRLFLQAAIVRVMKARKELKHVQLVREVIDQAKGRFSASVMAIKRAIEFLIEKDNLIRMIQILEAMGR